MRLGTTTSPSRSARVDAIVDVVAAMAPRSSTARLSSPSSRSIAPPMEAATSSTDFGPCSVWMPSAGTKKFWVVVHI